MIDQNMVALAKTIFPSPTGSYLGGAPTIKTRRRVPTPLTSTTFVEMNI